MILNVYNIYDEALESFVSQFLFQNDKVAERSFSSYFQNGALFRQHPDMEKYPNTFKVVRTATFDDQTGRYEPLDLLVDLFDFSKFYKEELPTVPVEFSKKTKKK